MHSQPGTLSRRQETHSKKQETQAREKNDSRSTVDQERYYRKYADFQYMSAYNMKAVKEVGRGGYGVVYKVVDTLLHDKEYACKINFGTVAQEVIYCEIAVLQLINGHRNLPALEHIIIHNSVPHVFLRYFPNKPFITFFGTFGIQEIKHYLLELLIGLKSLKNLGILHRDIKPGNFLYNPELKKGVIVDFGLAEIDKSFFKKQYSKAQQLQKEFNRRERLYDQETMKFRETFLTYQRIYHAISAVGTNKIGTESYMPLQSLLHHPSQSYSSDIWPVGVIMLQFFLRKYTIFHSLKLPYTDKELKNTFIPVCILEFCIIFGSDAVIEQCKNLGYGLQLPKVIPKIDINDLICVEDVGDTGRDLLQKLLDLNFETRITVEDAIAHPFFDSIRDEHLS